MSKSNDVEYDERVGAPVDKATGQVNPDQAPPDQTPDFDGNYTGWHRDGQPVAPFPAPDGGVDFKTDHFQSATIAPAITDEVRAAVQRQNKGDAGLDDERIISADAMRRGESDDLGDMTKAGRERQAEQEKAAEKKAKVEQAKGA